MERRFRMVRSIVAGISDVWENLVLSQNFVVPPQQPWRVAHTNLSKLSLGEVLFARMAIGPLPARSWTIETHDLDAGLVMARGAEGFCGELLWDFEIRLAVANKRCIVDYSVLAPPERRFGRPAVGLERFFERRHDNIRSAVAAQLASLRQCAALYNGDGCDEPGTSPVGPRGHDFTGLTHRLVQH
jgi:hypothetical protein